MITGLRPAMLVCVALALSAPALAHTDHAQAKPGAFHDIHDEGDHTHDDAALPGAILERGGLGVSAEEHHADHTDDDHAGEHATGVPELPNLLGVIHHYLVVEHPETAQEMDNFAAALGFNDPLFTPFQTFENVIYMVFIIALIIGFALAARRRLRVAPPVGGRLSRRAMLAEIVVTFFEDFFAGILGKGDVRRHLPFIGTLFIYIFVCNTMGLIWLGKAPTANLSFNAGMALLVFFYVHVGAIMRSPIGYLKHYPGSLPSIKELGAMGYVFVPFMAILFIIIHVMEAFIQPMSLSLRLFGNVLGKDVLLGVFGGLAPYVPLHTPFLFLGLLLGTIQALIFSLLTAVYITLWTPHDDHGHDGHHDDGHQPGFGPEDVYQHPAHEGVHA